MGLCGSPAPRGHICSWFAPRQRAQFPLRWGGGRPQRATATHSPGPHSAAGAPPCLPGSPVSCSSPAPPSSCCSAGLSSVPSSSPDRSLGDRAGAGRPLRRGGRRARGSQASSDLDVLLLGQSRGQGSPARLGGPRAPDPREDWTPDQAEEQQVPADCDSFPRDGTGALAGGEGPTGELCASFRFHKLPVSVPCETEQNTSDVSKYVNVDSRSPDFPTPGWQTYFILGHRAGVSFPALCI